LPAIHRPGNKNTFMPHKLPRSSKSRVGVLEATHCSSGFFPERRSHPRRWIHQSNSAFAPTIVVTNPNLESPSL
jgi:hypothetical protein